MKKLILYLCIPLLFASCSVALFDKAPGVDIKEFPSTLQGEYYLKVPQGLFKKKTDKDTLFLMINANSYAIKDSLEVEHKTLDKDNKIVLVKGIYYVLAQRDEEYPAYWKYSFLVPTKRGAKIHPVITGNGNTTLHKYFKRELLKVKDNTDSTFVYKTNDDQLVKYYERVLKKDEALEVIRLKK
jgi:hypothetical protein